MPGAGKTGLMGAAHPQTPRRSPRHAFGGNPATPQGGKQTNDKQNTKELRNPQSFSYEVSHLRGHGNTSGLSVPSYDNFLLLRLAQKSGKIIFDPIRGALGRTGILKAFTTSAR